jgi:DNA mismatch repair protein MutS
MPPKKTINKENTDNSMYSHYVKVLDEAIQKYGKQTIVFYQCGSFFELYNLQNKDTEKNRYEIVEEFCELTGMTMSCNKKTEWNNYYIVLAGFPEHSCEKFIKLAIQNGYTAVIYIQSKNPMSKQREYFMTYSPGTYLSYDSENNQQLTNNIMCIWLETFQPFASINKTKQMVCGIAASHIFTGETVLFQYDSNFYMNPTTFDELERAVSSINPSEIIFISNLDERSISQISQFSGIYTGNRKTHFLSIQEENQKQILENCQKQTYISHMISTFYGQDAYETCSEFYEYLIATQSFCYLLHFLQEHNPDLIKKIAFPTFNNVGNRMILANHTLKQLNIIDDDTIDGKNAGKFSSVLAFLNKCITPMGKRHFQQQLINPTFDIEWLQTEYDATGTAIEENLLGNYDIRQRLRKIRDLDKICRQIVIKRIYPHSIYTLYDSIRTILAIFYDISTNKDTIEYLCDTEDIDLNNMIESFLQYIDSVLYIDLCKGVETTTIFTENIIKPGISGELDQISQQYRENITLFDNIKKVLNDMMCESEQVVDGDFIKVHSTEKSGNTLQITRKRGQTLRKIIDKAQIIGITPNFRILSKDIQFIKAGASNDEIDFPQLTHLLKQIGSLKDRLSSEISRIYFEILQKIEDDWYLKIEQIISFITRLDILQCKAYIAEEYNYCKPTIDTEVDNQSYIQATGIRHVLIEHLQKNEIYVTNDIQLGIDKNGILLFGTNAVGKTSFIRAIGILIIMAQSGLYVPCSTFHYLPYRSIFSRILGNDNLFKGLSTFAVEMSELRVILKMADKYSLVLGDELCSGTEIESALSLFSMGLVDLHKKGSTFLFATHFHEIIQYEEIQQLDKLDIKHMAVYYDPANQCLIYDRKLADGQGSRTYGLEVCKSLFLEEDFLDRAYQFRQTYFPESGGELNHGTSRYNSSKIKGFCENCKKSLATETHHLSPQKYADEKGFIGSFHKDHPANLMALCENCHLSIHKEDKILVKKKTTTGVKHIKK